MGMDDTMKASMALCNYIKHCDCTPQGVEKRRHQVFNCVLRDMGFTRKQRSFMWRELVAGNWERLHVEEGDEKFPEMWLDDLRWDTFYSADRWSLDQLMRNHWRFRHYMEEATGSCGCKVVNQ